MEETNQDVLDRNELIRLIQELSDLYGQISDPFRQSAFSTTALILAHHRGPIPTGAKLRQIPGIGESSAKIIEEWSKTGTIARLEDLRKQVTNKTPSSISLEQIEKNRVLEQFQEIHGVGPKAAEKWYEWGWRTLEDIDPNQLTHSQKVGLANLIDLKDKIPRDEIDIFRQYLEVMLSNIKFEIAGSYRRGEPESGDIDVLLMETEGYTLSYLVDEMIKRNLIIETLGLGSTKFMGLIRLGPEYKARRLDLRWVPKESWPFALLYFTGSGELNKKMRHKAITMGLTLSEYNLRHLETDQYIPAETEEDIFEALEMEYLPVTSRSISD